MGKTVITVVSTGFHAPTRARCITSVAVQTIKARHIYIEASEQTPPRSVTENVYTAVLDLPPDEIVAWLDGDDWLAHPFALERILNLYEAGADCTYGSFRFADGRSGNCRAYENPRNFRSEPWLATHLKTFRARLLQAAKPDELQIDGEWITMACDMAIMFAVLERAEHPTFCEEELCVYNYASSWEHRMTEAERARERAVVRRLRG